MSSGAHRVRDATIRKQGEQKEDSQACAKRDETTGIESGKQADVLLESTICAHSALISEKR